MAEEQVINGYTVDSQDEWRFYLALMELKLDFFYQYQLGDPRLRGGQRIDFVVFVPPLAWACEIGWEGYYHSTKQRAADTMQDYIIHTRTKFHIAKFTLDETATVEAAKQAIQKKLGA